jgi:4-hydroxybenzoate polyprenyltransferase
MPDAVSFPLAIVRQLRPHQWLKNALLFVPLALAHHLSDLNAVVMVTVGAVCFSLAASAIYTINDIVDRDADRTHPHKRDRPIAAGVITINQGYMLAMVLLMISAVIAWWVLPAPFLNMLVIYVAITTAYSFVLKKVVLLDVIVLAGLYVLRVAAGGAVASVPVSPWLFTFALFFFTSLAFLKRYTELKATVERDGRKISGRGYHVGDAEFILVAGSSVGLLSMLVIALYLQSEQVTALYAHPEWLWLVVPGLTYWVGRLWLLAHRGEMHEDAIHFAMRDGASYLVALFLIAVVTLARLT